MKTAVPVGEGRQSREASGIKPEKMVDIGGQDALQQVKEGKIEAMF
ncbi:MAG: hypothetical protein P4L43_16045 [Syntrophobacteraceae bacterium]|nr:hypothetical protein [Syntrophobacteraceae bacterium]